MDHRPLDVDLIVSAMNAAFSQFASDELRPLRVELVQQVAILEERQRVAERDRVAALTDQEQLQQRLYMLVAGVTLALLGAVLSFVLR